MKLFRNLKFNRYQADHASSMDHRMSDAKKCHEDYQKLLRSAYLLHLLVLFTLLILLVFVAFSMVGLAFGINLFESTLYVYFALVISLFSEAIVKLKADFSYWMWRQSLRQADAEKDD